MLPQLVSHLLNDLYMLFALTFNVDKDVIKIQYHKNVKLLCQDLVHIPLKCSQCVCQSKRHDLIFEMTIADLESRLPFIAFPDLHSMVGISQIKLGETSSLT